MNTSPVMTETESLRSINDENFKHAVEIETRVTQVLERLHAPLPSGTDAPSRSGMIGQAMDHRSRLLSIEDMLGRVLNLLG